MRIIFLVLILGIFACDNRPPFEKMVDKELASGIRNDSLFLGFYFGMTRKDFFAYCWEKNKDGTFSHGAKNTTVEYKINELTHPAKMNFYPLFHEEKINEMPIWFTYEGWAPWNKELQADKLQKDVIALMEKWYNKPLVKINRQKKGITHSNVYGTIDGNRAIKVEVEDQLTIKATLIDLTVIPDRIKNKNK